MSNIINFEWFKTKKIVDNLSDKQLAYDKRIMDNVYKGEIKAFESMLKFIDRPDLIKMWMLGWVKDKKKFLKKDIKDMINEKVGKV